MGYPRALAGHVSIDAAAASKNRDTTDVMRSDVPPCRLSFRDDRAVRPPKREPKCAKAAAVVAIHGCSSSADPSQTASRPRDLGLITKQYH